MSRSRVAIAVVAVVVASMPLRAQVAPDVARRQINTVYPEYPADALQRGIKGTVVVDITVNGEGDVSTAGVVSGPQELHASAFRAALGLKYTKGPGVIAMKVAFDYTLSGTSWGVSVRHTVPDIAFRSQAPNSVALSDTAGPDATGAVRIGGAIRPPKKLKDAAPVYPPIAREARVQGVVIMEVRIDEHGNVSDVRTLRSIPLLDQAAIDAVTQWQYTPTLLNGVAVPVIMTATVNFTLRDQVALKINMPDGSLTLLRIAPNGGIGRTDNPAMSQFGFAPLVAEDPSAQVKITIYEFGDSGTPPRVLGTVDVAPGAGVVQSPTEPSFGIEVVSVDRTR